MNLTGKSRRKPGKGLIRSLSAPSAIRQTSLITWVSRPVSSTSVRNAVMWVHLLLKGIKNRTCGKGKGNVRCKVGPVIHPEYKSFFILKSSIEG